MWLFKRGRRVSNSQPHPHTKRFHPSSAAPREEAPREPQYQQHQQHEHPPQSQQPQYDYQTEQHQQHQQHQQQYPPQQQQYQQGPPAEAMGHPAAADDGGAPRSHDQFFGGSDAASMIYGGSGGSGEGCGPAQEQAPLAPVDGNGGNGGGGPQWGGSKTIESSSDGYHRMNSKRSVRVGAPPGGSQNWMVGERVTSAASSVTRLESAGRNEAATAIRTTGQTFKSNIGNW